MARLTYRSLERLKPGEVLSDPGCRGLRFIGGPKGTYAQFRWKDAKSGRWLSKGLGRLPSARELVEIAAAERDSDSDSASGHVDMLEGTLDLFRRKVWAIKGGLGKGIDPRTGAGPDGLPLARALKLYEADLAARKVADAANVVSLLRRELVEPFGGQRALGTLDRATLVARLEEVKTKPHGKRYPKGRPGTAKHLASAAHTFLSWAADNGHVSANPLAGRRKPRRTRAERLKADEAENGRALSDDELATLWRVCEAHGDAAFGAYVRFIALVGQRRTETAAARWRDMDLDAGVWSLPAEITKSGRAHRVPLPSLAVELLRALRPDKPKPDALVFTGRGGKLMIGWSKRMRRKAVNRKTGATTWHGLAVEAEAAGLKGWTLHDLRRTVRTGYARLGVADEVAELALNHAVSDKLRAAYVRHDYWTERVDAAARWDRHVCELLGLPVPDAPSEAPRADAAPNVVALKRAG